MQRSYLNGVMTVIAVLLGLNLLVGARLVHGPAAAVAQVSVPEGENLPPFNAAEQRKQMIIQLDQINRRLSTIESRLNSGLRVEVTKMPPIRMDGQQGGGEAQRELKPGSRVEVNPIPAGAGGAGAAPGGGAGAGGQDGN